jgi:uncharacterized membrane protein/membrane-bound inhibitor of C-type lysozyme
MKRNRRSTRWCQGVVPALAVPALVGFAGCASGGSGGSGQFAGFEAVPFAADNTFVYRCNNDFRFSVQVHDESVDVRYGMGSVTLPRVAAESGERYSAEGITFWNQGQEGLLETPAFTYTNCDGRHAPDPWVESGLLGYDFRAVGQEPGWLLEIDNEKGMRIFSDYGETAIEISETPDRVAESSNSWSYTVRGGPEDLRVVIADSTCQDVMSGERFPSAVILTLNGQELSGCGQSLAGITLSPLARNDWYLTYLAFWPVNRSVGQTQAAIRFDVERFRVFGHSGCNSFVGPYSMNGDRILFRPLIVTSQMSCLGSGEVEQERRLFAALQRTDRYSIEDGVLTFYAGNSPVARFSASAELE